MDSSLGGRTMQRNIIELPKLGNIYRGHVKVTARNVLTNETKILFDDNNTIIKPIIENSGYSFFKNNGNGYLIGYGPHDVWANEDTILKTVLLGTSNTPASLSDTGLKGTQLASNSSGTTITSSTFGQSPVSIKRKWVFAAGVGTGSVGEVVLSSGNVFVARQVLETLFDKTVLHELTVEWTLEFSAGSWNGTIFAGQRDGITDVAWNLTINNRQAWRLAAGCAAAGWNRSSLIWDRTAIRIKTGTSNTVSDLVNDAVGTIKGTQLFSGYPSLSSFESYTDGNYYREINIKLDTGQSNGQIGELLFTANYGEENDHYIFRCTFTPALDKTSAYQLLLTFRISM
jgi:hypothetical protein